MKVLVLLAMVVLASSHSLNSNNAILRKNSEAATKFAKMLTLSAFSRMETKLKSINAPKFPVIPPVADPYHLENEIYSFAEDTAYAHLLSGNASRCDAVLTGGSTIVDDLTIDISIPAAINYKLNIGSLHLEGGHDTNLVFLEDVLHLTSYGNFFLDLKNLETAFGIKVLIYPLGKFKVTAVNIDIAFEKIEMFAENALGNGEPIDWAAVNENIKPKFDTLFAQYKPQIEELIKSTVTEMTKTCNIYVMIGGDFSCIGAEDLLEMAQVDLLDFVDTKESPCRAHALPSEKYPAIYQSMPLEDQYLLYSENTTDNGDWAQSIEMCPEGTYVQGFQIKNERYQGPADDTCMNGLRLICGNQTDSPNIQSLDGAWGSWGVEQFCEDGEEFGYANGFQLLAEEGGQPDDTAANNLRLFCSANPLTPLEGDGNTFGEWRGIQRCKENYRVCGLKTQVQPDQGLFRDDTALNNLAFLCCLPKN